MDQAAWDQVYLDLDKDIAELQARGGKINPLDVAVAIDRARITMDRGDSDEAIAIIQEVKRSLRGGQEVVPLSRSAAGASPAVDRLDQIEDRLHAETRLGSARLEIVGEDEEPPTRASSQNTKVNKSIKYDDIKDEYVKLWNACKLRDEKRSAVRREADRVVANRKVYEEIAAETKVPWWFVGLIHGMECSFSLNKHLHNGDSLKARTWQVPAGRPKEGGPPFEFVDSAVDALEYDGFAGKTDWPLPMVLFRLERYNGFGYRRKFGFASPYLWSYTNHFTSGKYVRDGVFDSNAVSKQCGAAAMLRDLIERNIVSFEAKPVVVAAPQPAPAPPAPPSPAPVAQPAPQPAPAPAAPPAPAPVAQPAPQPAPAPAAPPPPAPVAQPAPQPAPAPAAPPAAAPVAQPAPQPAPAPAAPPPPAPVAQPAPQPAPAPAAPPAPAPVAQPAPQPAPAAPPAVAAPAPAAPQQQVAAAVVPPTAPATPAPAPAAVAPAAPTPAPATPAAPPSPAPAGVSSAVAAAIAELAKKD